MDRLKHWLAAQCTERTVEPNSSVGKALQYLLTHWQTLTQCLQMPGAPLDNNTAERALKLAIRQRKNSVFLATEHGAYVGSLLTSLLATCVHASVNALDYLVALQEHRAAVFRDPAAWLPWHYHAHLAPPEASCRQSSAMPACCGLPFHSMRANARADRRVLASCVVGHHVQRPWDKRLVQSQKPCPSSTRICSVVPARFRKT